MAARVPPLSTGERRLFRPCLASAQCPIGACVPGVAGFPRTKLGNGHNDGRIDMSERFDGISLIEEIQQNRSPWLMVDRIDECEPGKRVVATKNFSLNEWFFPAEIEAGRPVPSFILFECMVQSFILTFLSADKYKGMQTADVSIDDMEVHRFVHAGETMSLVADLTSIRFGIATGRCRGLIGGELVTEASMVVAIPEILNKMSPAGRK